MLNETTNWFTDLIYELEAKKTDIASLIGTSNQTISRLCNDPSPFKLESFKKIVEHYKLSDDEIVYIIRK